MLSHASRIIFYVLLAVSFEGCGFTLPSRAQTIQSHAQGNALEALFIQIDGEIKPGFAERFEDYMEDEQNSVEGYRVRLNSPGGSLLEGLKLGYILRKRGFHTEVGRSKNVDPFQTGLDHAELTDGVCYSACAIAFLGGIMRQVESAERLGFHQFFLSPSVDSIPAFSELTAETAAAVGVGQAQIMSGLIVKFIVEMGVDARLFTKTAIAQPNELFTPSRQEAIDYRIVTPRGFGRWFIEPYKDGIIAASKRIDPVTPYDRVYQTTLFCTKGGSGKATLMLTAKGMAGLNVDASMNPAVPAELTVLLTGGSKKEIQIPREQVTVHGDDKTARIKISLGTAEIASIMAAETFAARFIVPRVSGGYGAYHELQGRDREMIRSAFMHCI